MTNTVHKSHFTLAKFAAKMPAAGTRAALSLATLGRMTQIRLLIFVATLPKETKVSRGCQSTGTNIAKGSYTHAIVVLQFR